MADDLVEKVAKILAEFDGDDKSEWPLYAAEAAAAIRVVLEEAANKHRKGKLGLWRVRRAAITAAIRAMMPREDV